MEQVLAAIHALYHAWSTALQLLRHPSAEVQFVGANVLYSKAKSDWTIVSSSSSSSAAAASFSAAAASAPASAAAVAPGGLSAADQGQVMNQLLVSLKALCEPNDRPTPTPPFVLSKLAQALGLMAVKTPQGPAELLASVLPLVVASSPSVSSPSASPPPTPAPFPSPAWLVVLELLTALGEEVPRASLGYTKGEEVQAQLRRQSDNVAATIAKALREANAILQQQQQQSPQQLKSVSTLVSKALQVLLSWRDFGLSLVAQHSSGILTPLLELCARWANVSLGDADASSSSLALLQSAVESIEHSLDESSYPRPRGRDACVDLIVQLLVQALRPVYERTVAECVALRARSSGNNGGSGGHVSPAVSDILERADQLCLLICRISCAVGESESDMDYLSCTPSDGDDAIPTLTPGGTNYAGSPTSPGARNNAAAAAPNPLHLQYFELHLLFSAHPYNRLLSEQSLQVWSTLQDMPVASRKFAWLKGELFAQLLAILLRQIAYPRAFRSWTEPMRPSTAPASSASASAAAAELSSDAYWFATFLEDRDAFLRLRGRIFETLLAIQGILGARYVELLARAIEEEAASTAAAGGAGAGAAAVGLSASWQRYESILFALNAVAGDVREAFSDPDEPLERKRMLHQHLSSVLARVWTLAPPTPAANLSAEAARAQSASSAASAAPPLLLASSCAFLKSFAFLASYAAQPQAQEMLERGVAFLLGALPHTQAPQTAVPSSSGRNNNGAARSMSSNELFSSEAGALADQANVAGLAFRALCASEATWGSMLARSPAVLAEVVRLLFRAPGWSEHVSTEMKNLWLQGLAGIVATIAYSDDTVAQLGAQLSASASASAASSPAAQQQQPQPPALAMASSYLAEITNPILGGLSAVVAHVAAGQAAASAAAAAAGQQQQGWTPPPAELEAVRGEMHKHLSLLLGVLDRLAPPLSANVLQSREKLLDLVEQASRTPALVRTVPPSVAFGVFSSCWPTLQQACAFLLSLRDMDGLNLLVRLYATTFPLLYTHELAPLLPALLQAVLPLYKALPLPSVLTLLRTAVSSAHFGASPEMRDQWNACMASLYRCTMAHVKEGGGLRAHAELFEAFWPCLLAFYEHATYAFISNPSNTLPHVLQLAVTLLDSLSTHRGAMKAVLNFLEAFLGSSAPIDVLDPLSRRELHTLVEGVVGEQGSGLVRQLVALVTDKATLPPALDRQIISLLLLTLQRWPGPDRADKWISSAVLSDYVGTPLPHLREEDKHLFLALALGQPALRNNKHQWINLWVEFGKVCQRNASMDDLRSFQIVANKGTLRGSPAMDAAFATL